MRYLLPALAMIVVVACLPYRPISQSGKYTPEVPQPSEARIAELARVPDAVPTEAPRAMRVDVSPRQILLGGAAEARCFIPRDAHNRGMKLAIADRASYADLGSARDRVEFTLPVPPLPCGQYEVLCAVERDDRRIVIAAPSVWLTVSGCGDRDDGAPESPLRH